MKNDFNEILNYIIKLLLISFGVSYLVDNYCTNTIVILLALGIGEIVYSSLKKYKLKKNSEYDYKLFTKYSLLKEYIDELDESWCDNFYILLDYLKTNNEEELDIEDIDRIKYDINKCFDKIIDKLKDSGYDIYISLDSKHIILSKDSGIVKYINADISNNAEDDHILEEKNNLNEKDLNNQSNIDYRIHMFIDYDLKNKIPKDIQSNNITIQYLYIDKGQSLEDMIYSYFQNAVDTNIDKDITIIYTHRNNTFNHLIPDSVNSLTENLDKNREIVINDIINRIELNS